MDIIARRTGRGKSTELIKRFFKDDYSRLFISSKMNLHELIDIAGNGLGLDLNKLADCDSFIEFVDDEVKLEDVNNILERYKRNSKTIESVYIDGVRSIRDVMSKVVDMEEEFCVNITMTAQVDVGTNVPDVGDLFK